MAPSHSFKKAIALHQELQSLVKNYQELYNLKILAIASLSYRLA
ncbi:MAG: hypothetical protein SW833_07785 [Cyanobacteriota bacterium]|nr:hypothetical protein [Cyanobacteriota bacterium]